MNVVIHGHQTDITSALRRRAQEGVDKLSTHYKRLQSAEIIFAEDGVFKSVEIIVQVPNSTKLTAKSEAKYHETALSDAIDKIDAQIRKLKAGEKKQIHASVELPA